MANKQTIQDIDEALDRWHRRLTMAVRKIDELRAKKKKIRMGKIKQPEPEPVKVMFGRPAFDDDISDVGERPISPGSTTPC